MIYKCLKPIEKHTMKMCAKKMKKTPKHYETENKSLAHC